MASTSSILAPTFPVRCMRIAADATSGKPHSTKASPAAVTGRRQWIVLLTATTALKGMEMPSRAEDIGLFGLRKKLKKVEEEAELLVKEGFEAADKGIEAAEKGIEAAETGLSTAEKGIEAAEKEIETAASFGGLAQAGAVAAAEFLGILVATSIVNGILGPEAQKS
nr:uncharacterized protein LOC109189255 [Ipomoea batatas]